MTEYDSVQIKLKSSVHTWLITGVSGFIGSNLLESLLKLNQIVIGVDNFSRGYQHNLDEVQSLVTPEQWLKFKFIRGDIRDIETCRLACHNVDFVLHQAAHGSVPRSIEDPISFNQNNVDGFLNILIASRDAKVKRFVFASSSSVYGDHPDLPKVEDKIGKPLSPYAVTKFLNELYAEVFAKTYGIETIGLRYFNIFGRRQDPIGSYAAVIPKWIASMIKNEPIYINGDGETSRDFCYVENAIQANLLAAMTMNLDAISTVYNVAVGGRTTLNQLYATIKDGLKNKYTHLTNSTPIYREFRSGDIRHSLASINKAENLLGYQPLYEVGVGITESLIWYVDNLSRKIDPA